MAFINHIRLFLFLGLFTLNCQAIAQNEVDKLMANGNFDDALELLSQRDASTLTPDEQYKIAVCVINGSMYSKGLAVDFFNKYLDVNPQDGNAQYLYGRALAFEQRFDEAEQALSNCLIAKEISKENRADAGRQLEYCQNARVLIPYRIEASIENLGTKVNSGFSDYYPFSTGNESGLYFNSRRNDGSVEKPNGEFTSNIYFSEVDGEGKFKDAVLLKGKINNPEYDEELVGLSPDGKKAIISVEEKAGNIDLKIANLDKGSIVSFENLPKGVNTSAQEISATFGTTVNEIYFASNREGGYGGTDLYVIRKNHNGKWAKPQNLGPEINTRYDEDFPNLSDDGKFLFFSSKGHSSIGGYDIFKAEWDPGVVRFVKPVNVGYPVNTLFDDMNLDFSETGRYGYVSRLTEKDNTDIFRVTFEEVEEEITVVTGTIKVDKQEGELLSGILMVVEDLRTGDLSGEYLPNPTTMRYVMALKPGVYKVTISIDGFEPLEEKIQIADKGGYSPEINIDYNIKRN